MNAPLNKPGQKELTIPELAVDYTPLSISFNFDEINDRLDVYLGEKISVVTEETIKDEKKIIAGLRKEGALIKSTFKSYRDKAVLPITEAEAKISYLVAKFISVADDKWAQVANLENVTRGIIAETLKSQLHEEWDALAVAPEFRKATTDDMVKLTAQTATGALTKAALTEVKSRANVDFQKQITIQARLMSVENKSLRADINPPLSRANVEAFLYSDDFDAKLDALVAAEVLRKEEAEQRMRKKLEAEKLREIEAALKAQQAEATRKAREEAELSRPKPEPIAPTEKAPEAQRAETQALKPQPKAVEPPQNINTVKYTVKTTISVVEVYDFEAKQGTDIERIKRYFAAKLVDEGKNVISVDVEIKL